MNSSTPTLANTIKRLVESQLAGINSALVGKVEKYNDVTKKADIKPYFKQTLVDGTEKELPILTSVPVVFPRSRKAILSFPLEVGDNVLVVFMQRSIDEWLETGKLYAPKDKRRFSYNDAVAMPGLYPFSEVSSLSTGNLLLQFNSSKLEIMADGALKLSNPASNVEVTADGQVNIVGAGGSVTLDAGGNISINGGTAGKIAIGNSTNELLTIIDSVLTLLSTTVVATALGPQPLSSAAGILAEQVKLATIKGTL